MWTVTSHNKAYSNFSLLSDSEKNNWNAFLGYVRRDQKHPSVAAAEVGSVGGAAKMGYKKLRDTQYQIRLSNSERATFFLQKSEDGQNDILNVRQVGGHT